MLPHFYTNGLGGITTRKLAITSIEGQPVSCIYFHRNSINLKILWRIIQSRARSRLQLIVGVPQLAGPGKSAADISDVLLNSHRVGKERQKIKGVTSQTGDGLIALFSEFDRKHPGFIMQNNVGAQTVISLQTNFTRSQMVKKERLDGPVNGLVNDAAHGYWTERNPLLMITSTYCPDLLCWVPGVMSYTNGASAEHFHYHFLAVLRSIVQEATFQNIPITDNLFAWAEVYVVIWLNYNNLILI